MALTASIMISHYLIKDWKINILIGTLSGFLGWAFATTFILIDPRIDFSMQILMQFLFPIAFSLMTSKGYRDNNDSF